MVFLITGGAGFVGSYLALFLKAQYPQASVIAFDNLKRSGSELNLPRLRNAGVQFIHGDVRNPADLDLPKVDCILECSAEPSALAGRDGGMDYLIHTNLLGTYHCLELARKHQAQMIFLSTSRVYPVKAIQELPYNEEETRLTLNDQGGIQGVSEKGISEEFSLHGARTLYGSTKLASELLITEYVDNFDLEIVINRCGVLTGAWQMGKVDQGVAVLWMARHVFGGKLSYIGYGGRGKQVRDLLHISDLANLVMLQLKVMPQLKGEIFNIGGGLQNSLSLLEMTGLCEDITNNEIEIFPDLEGRPGDVPWYVTDSSKAKALFNWEPKQNCTQIFQEIYEWIRDNQDSLKLILN